MRLEGSELGLSTRGGGQLMKESLLRATFLSFKTLQRCLLFFESNGEPLQGFDIESTFSWLPGEHVTGETAIEHCAARPPCS